jgi:sorting nexin-1/2
MDSVDLEDDTEPSVGPGAPPPVVPPSTSTVPRRFQPSVSIEQAANPSFEITVGDPHKVGDLTSSHIVYHVRTKARHMSLVNPSIQYKANSDDITADVLKSI